MRWSRAVALLGTLALELACVGGARAQTEVPPDRQVLILSKALSYDTALPSRVGDDISIAVLARTGHAASEAMGAVMLRAWKEARHMKVQGRGLVVRALPYTTPAALAAAVAEHNIDVLYVCAGLDPDLPAITELTRKRRITTFASSQDQVNRGLALGVFPVDSRPSIVINLTAARSEGATFGSELLRVANVIKGN